MNDMEYLPLALGFPLILATMARRRLYASAQSLRLELAEKGERLLAKSDLPEELRRNTRLLLTTTFGGGWLIFASIVMCPFVALVIMVRPSLLNNMAQRLSLASAEVRALHQEVRSLHDRIMLANHPMLWTILQAELILEIPLVIIVISVVRGKMPKEDRLLILSVMESRNIGDFARRVTAFFGLPLPT